MMIKFQMKFFGYGQIACLLSRRGRDTSCRGYVVSIYTQFNHIRRILSEILSLSIFTYKQCSKLQYSNFRQLTQKLLVFERKILRRIFGPTKGNQKWRVKTNEELDKLIKLKNVINYINP